jgi:hypothetical protein
MLPVAQQAAILLSFISFRAAEITALHRPYFVDEDRYLIFQSG